jgi:uncharacterized repeat protein (TIGR01451 family)
MKNKFLLLLFCAGIFFFNSCNKNDEVPSTDLTVTISASDLKPVVGTNMTLTIVAHNNGPGNATGVDVTNNLPTGYTVVSSIPTVGAVGERAWTIGSLANGASATLVLTLTVLPTGTYPYAVSILGADTESDPSTSNNSGFATVEPVNPTVDLSVTQTVSNSAPVVGTDVTFIISVKNNGLYEANGVGANNSLAAGYTLVSASQTNGTWSSPIWTIGKLAKGAEATLTIIAKVNATGPYSNTATVGGVEGDSNTANNTSTVTTIPVPAAAKITYDHDVKPLLVASCTPCHVSGGYQKKWDVYATAKSSITGIINRVSRAQGSSGFMPQGGPKMSDANIALLNQWVTDGLLEK